jgi:hypothetical protein
MRNKFVLTLVHGPSGTLEAARQGSNELVHPVDNETKLKRKKVPTFNEVKDFKI